MKTLLVIEVIPLLLFIAAAIVFVRYRKEILAALIASPIPPVP
jgi:hypothetical protein